MNKTVIQVPAGIRYISEWENYKLLEFPHILDKRIPGCGFTEYCITNNQNVILASPRKILLENKEAQHPNEVLLIKNKLDNVLRIDKNLEKRDTMLIENEFTQAERAQIISDLQANIRSYIKGCQNMGIPAKLLVTYDSYRLVKDVLVKDGIFDSFYTVIDEFQSIFTDSRFKSDTELVFVNNLIGVNRVCYVSATPMLEKYLDMLKEFKDLPYYELDWEALDPLRIRRPSIKVRTTKSILTTAAKIIEEYKKGNFEKEIIQDNSPMGYHYIESREAVFYVNSVSNIINIICKAGLTADETNILCSCTPENEKKIWSRLKKRDGWKIGSVPLRNEERKMFTFCTRTVYLGADFYSDNARSFVLSDANVETLAVDITLDLPQIMGRQRLINNPWRNRAELYYKTLTNGNVILKDEFDAILKRKLNKSADLLQVKEDCSTSNGLIAYSEKLIDSIRLVNYKNDYVSVNKHTGCLPEPVLNNLVLVAEMRAYDIQQVDYKDRFSVFNAVYDMGLTEVNRVKVCNFIEVINNQTDYYHELKTLCDGSIDFCKEEMDIILDSLYFDNKKLIVESYKKLGPEGCKKYGYNYAKIKSAISVNEFNRESLKELIQTNFKIGDVVPKADMKVCLQAVYDKLKFNKKAKAKDIEQYFNIEEVQLSVKNKGRVWSYKLISKID